MAGMRYLTSRCPAHLHDMRMEKPGHYADLWRCRKCDVPIYYIRDESHLAEPEPEYTVAVHIAPTVRPSTDPKPYIKRKAETAEWPDR